MPVYYWFSWVSPLYCLSRQPVQPPFVGTGKFETPTMTILFSFTGNIIGDPNARAVVTISGAVTQSNDPALLKIPVTVNGLVESDTTQISLTLGAVGDPNQKTFVGAGLISIETNGR